MKRFSKPFTQQESIPEKGIEQAIEVLRSGRLHRYNTAPGELGEAATLEAEYAVYQGARYCLAVTSGGQALQIAARAAGLRPGDPILANAYTLAPVPGAMHAAGGVPVFVEIGDDWLIDIGDLREKAAESGSKFLMLSHMRGHIADMDAVVEICEEFGITLIEDCAHTMGARWKGTLSGNHGKVACFSTQTYKHMNSGEGGFLTTDDEELAARATILSGSYMLYERHGASPSDDVFRRFRLDTPNCSARLDNLRAAILRAQLPFLDDNIRRWNERYRVIEDGLRGAPGLRVVEREQHEAFVGSSIQFHADGLKPGGIPALIDGCLARGVELKWFGREEPVDFTSRYDTWLYIDNIPVLPKTLKTLSTTCDMRVPLTFDIDDCRDIAEVIAEEAAKVAA
jgi:dTDP-4-amino-4,6-dideoxygalactose transaminase